MLETSSSLVRGVFHGLALVGLLSHCGGGSATPMISPPLEEAGSDVATPVASDAARPGDAAPLIDAFDGGADGPCGRVAPSEPQGRPQGVEACPETIPNGALNHLGGGAACTTKADCVSEGEWAWCRGGECHVDQGVTASGCPSGQACGCGNISGGASGTYANRCVDARCRVDSDCPSPGTGGCAPSRNGRCNEVTGYDCHSPADECQSDADCCGSGSGVPGDARACRFLPSLGHWICGYVWACFG
jgi:hypothetical protein